MIHQWMLSSLTACSITFLLLFCPSTALPQTDRIVFLAFADGDNKIHVMNADGSNLHRVGTLPGRYGDVRFNPDNLKIVFTYFQPSEGTPQIYIMSTDGTNVRRLTEPPSSHRLWQITAHGEIIYSHELNPASSTPPLTETYIMNQDGSTKRPFRIVAPDIGTLGSDTSEFVLCPGRMVAFTKTNFGTYNSEHIYTMEIARNELRRLTSSIDSSRYLACSPDGKQIAYANVGASGITLQAHHDDDGIYVMNVDGTNARRIVKIKFGEELRPSDTFGTGPGRDIVQLIGPLSFNSDGSKLTYSVHLGNGNDQIYIVNTDGTDMKLLANGTHPSFSR
jgi:Tol biopolymer transport system component